MQGIFCRQCSLNKINRKFHGYTFPPRKTLELCLIRVCKVWINILKLIFFPFNLHWSDNISVFYKTTDAVIYLNVEIISYSERKKITTLLFWGLLFWSYIRKRLSIRVEARSGLFVDVTDRHDCCQTLEALNWSTGLQLLFKHWSGDSRWLPHNVKCI